MGNTVVCPIACFGARFFSTAYQTSRVIYVFVKCRLGLLENLDKWNGDFLSVPCIDFDGYIPIMFTCGI